MKKFYLLTLIMSMCVTSLAQTKGDMFISGSIAVEGGKQTVKWSEDSYSESESSPLDFLFQGGIEFGYFLANNFKVGLSVYIPYLATPTDKDGGKWLKNQTLGIGLNPNIAIYTHITDRFYYAPEIGAQFEFGRYLEKLSNSEMYLYGYSGWGAYLNLISFEFRVSHKLAIGIHSGSLSYISATINYDDDFAFTTSQIKFNLNRAGISARIYF